MEILSPLTDYNQSLRGQQWVCTTTSGQCFQIWHGTYFWNFTEQSEKFDTTGKKVYLAACKCLDITPVSFFLKNIQEKRLNFRHRLLGAKGGQALALALEVKYFNVPYSCASSSQNFAFFFFLSKMFDRLSLELHPLHAALLNMLLNSKTKIYQFQKGISWTPFTAFCSKS